MRSLLIKSRKNRKGLSGAVTALILVIASVLIALIVVAFAFGFLSFGSTPTVQQDGAAVINDSSGTCALYVVLTSTGTVTVDSISVNGVVSSISSAITPGANSYDFALPSSANLAPGATVTVTLGLTDGQSVAISATVE
ncbi:hypothetical protein [Sulfuracidifex metallicus]|uniref:hypothetical protein n=1 Tax=Sulfuracidifex metallicus TaxID=47303 RepID=UPI0022732C29|nr:hypothetical protein [Sulfuracidifex metallicus]MCY0849132.1 hypothetical protein [Sulfuracidifex metallicus]